MNVPCVHLLEYLRFSFFKDKILVGTTLKRKSASNENYSATFSMSFSPYVVALFSFMLC